MSKINAGFKQIFSVVAKMLLTIWLKLKKRGRGIPCIAPHCGKGIYYKVAEPYFFICIHCPAECRRLYNP